MNYCHWYTELSSKTDDCLPLSCILSTRCVYKRTQVIVPVTKHKHTHILCHFVKCLSNVLMLTVAIITAFLIIIPTYLPLTADIICFGAKSHGKSTPNKLTQLFSINRTVAAWTAGFQWWRSGDIPRTQNVSKYMLVLAICLVSTSSCLGHQAAAGPHL